MVSAPATLEDVALPHNREAAKTMGTPVIGRAAYYMISEYFFAFIDDLPTTR